MEEKKLLESALLMYLQADTNGVIRNSGSRGELLNKAMIDIASHLQIGWFFDGESWQFDNTLARNKHLTDGDFKWRPA
jgi:hypothetical protein